MSCNSVEKSFLEKLRRYYVENPGRCCDVTFLVGPQKEVVRTSRIILEVACPEFIKLFDDTWGQAVSIGGDEQAENENGISLPLLDPQAFKIFLELLITEDVSVAALESLELSATDLLNVTQLCLEYKMTVIQQNLQTVMQKTVLSSGWAAFAETRNFLELSQPHLKTVLSSNELLADETEIAEAALNWAEFQCEKRKIEETRDNMREVLGGALFQIRFPLMTPAEFAQNNRLHDLLTEKEQLTIFRYISSIEKNSLSNTNLQFSTTKRISTHFSTLKYSTNFKIVNHPPFKCVGSDYYIRFRVNQRIALLGLEFLGPIDADSFYDVEADIRTKGSTKCSGNLTKTIFAKQNETFFVSFDEPVIVDATSLDYEWDDGHSEIHFSLKGPDTPCLNTSYEDFEVEQGDGVKFVCRWFDHPLANFRFRRC